MEKHLRLFEFGDMPWCPSIIRRSITELLVIISRKTGLFINTAPLLLEYLGDKRNILVLGAGSGGGILDVMGQVPETIKVTLTDLNPDLNFSTNDTRIVYETRPVDAAGDLSDYPGLRVIYDGFHHLSPHDAQRLLASTVDSGENIVIFEACDRSKGAWSACLKAPLLVMAFLPKTKNPGAAQLFLTYIVPIIPLVMLWDGFVSCLRVYSRRELQIMTQDLNDYEWKLGKLRGSQGEPIRTIAGRPRNICP